MAAMMLLLAACSQQPAEIHYGSDECSHCRMMITDARFASQLVTETGKVIKFDSIECLAGYTGDHKTELESAKAWVSDFNNPGRWLAVSKAQIIRSKVINSPMGASLLALEPGRETTQHLSEYPGRRMRWEQLVK